MNTGTLRAGLVAVLLGSSASFALAQTPQGIPALNPASAALGADVFPVSQGGSSASTRQTITALETFLNADAASLTNKTIDGTANTLLNLPSSALSGAIDAALLPNPGPSSLGGIQSFSAVTHQWIRSISTLGVPTASQPACADISDAQTGCSTVVGTMATQDASNVAITGGTITGLPSPINPTDAATAGYVNAALSGQVVWHSPPVSYATTAVLPNSPTYSNGTAGVGATLTDGTAGSVLSVDGQVGANVLNTDTLVQNQAAPAQNGIYRTTTAGVAGVTKWVLTRRADFDQAAMGEIALGAAVLVTVGGTANVAGSAFVMNQTAAITVGTTAITWAQNATGGAAYTGSHGVVLVGTDFQQAPIAANSVPANATAGSAAPTSAVAYSATPGANRIPLTGAGNTLAAGFLPNPSSTTLGGVQSKAAVANQFLNAISTGGVPTSAQPAFSNLSGQSTLAQLPSIANLTVLGNVAGGTTTPSALTGAQLTTLCAVFTTTTSGCAPASGTASGTKFLNDAGAYITVPGTGGGTNYIITTALVDAATIALDASATPGIQNFTLAPLGTGHTLSNPTGTTVGEQINLLITQPASGGPYSVLWGSAFNWLDSPGIAPVLNQTASATTSIRCTVTAATPVLWCNGPANSAFNETLIPGSPTPPASTSVYTMQGLAGSITPQTTGNIRAQVCGTIIYPAGSAAVNTGILYQLYYGTGIAPASAAAVTGTAIGTVGEYTTSVQPTAIGDVHEPFCTSAHIAALTPGTPYWVDLAAKSVTTANDVGFTALTLDIEEVR